MVATPGGDGTIAPLIAPPPGLGGGGNAHPRPTMASTKVIVGGANAPLRPTEGTEKVGSALAASSGDIVIAETASV